MGFDVRTTCATCKNMLLLDIKQTLIYNIQKGITIMEENKIIVSDEEIGKEKRSSTRNSPDSLLAIYILQTLKRYSSPAMKLNTKKVCEYLREGHIIAVCENDKDEQAQIKKVRRYLETLHKNYGNCIEKEKGKSRAIGDLWWYDASCDSFSIEESVSTHETLSNIEVDFLVDLLSSTKILNADGTRGLIDKLLKKTDLSDKERMRRLDKIQEEEWFKTPNEDLAEKKAAIEECFDYCNIVFDYENEESITATPLRWSFNGGICFLNAIVGGELRRFSLDKIRNYYGNHAEYENPEDCRHYVEETDSDRTTLDSVFVNIPTINQAILDGKCISFIYRSYKVDKSRVVFDDKENSVLPRCLTFSDGKYYLIGIDVDDSELSKVVYFRVDLMFELRCREEKVRLTGSQKHDFDAIERARVVDNHPLMISEKDVTVTFKIVESALDRIVDAFNVKYDRMRVTKETRTIKNSSDEGFHEEAIVSVNVRTSEEEAFRWALANADAVELVSPQYIRDRLGRIANPVYELYTQTIPDKVRANYDYVLSEGTFKISYKVDQDTANETYKELVKTGKIDVVDNVGVAGNDICELGDYFGDFINAKRLYLSTPELKSVSWASRLVNLKELELKNMSISDTSWMKDLKKLRQIYFVESPISDLSVLSEHEDIWYIDISGTEVSDISFIEKYKKLDFLNIVMCPIEDYSPLVEYFYSFFNCLFHIICIFL